MKIRIPRMPRVTLGNALLLLSLVGLVVALTRPALEGRALKRRVAAAVADVDALSAAARAARESAGQWPSAAEPGTTPPELAAFSASDSVFSRSDYKLAWSVWDMVDSVPAPPNPGPAAADAPPDTVGPRLLPSVHRVGSIVVYSADTTLLAELSAHYAGAAPVILDTMWLVVLPERSPVPQTRR